MRATSRARAAALVAGLTAVAAVWSPGVGTAGGRYSQNSKTLAPGVKYIKIVDSQGPNRIYLLKITPSYAAAVDVAKAGSAFPAYSRTSTMAGRYGAIAAVNGDFIEDGTPLHAFAEDGELMTKGLQKGSNFAIRADETASWVRESDPSITALKTWNGQTFQVNEWNSDNSPRAGEIHGYTDVGGSSYLPPTDACSVRLMPSSPPRWATNQAGVQRDYSVDKVVCQYSRITTAGGVVLAAKRGTSTANTLSSMTAGQTVRLTWTPGWNGVLDTIGGMPQLLRNGEVVAPASCGSYFCDRNPRTAIGITADGKVLLMVVDGREPGYSVGMDLVELAKELKRNGAVWAVNLDGGGSATMVVNGRVVNRPADGSERSVNTAVLVLPSADDGEPSGLRPAAPLVRAGGGFDPAVAAAVEAAVASDPGSTGGLLDADL